MRSSILGLFLFLVASLPAQQSSDVAMGVFPFLVGNMNNRVQEIVTTCAQNDIDTIYVSVFRTTSARRGELWITDLRGTWNSAWGSVRPGGAGIELRSLVQAAHARDLRVVAVIKCFDDDVQPTDASHRQYLLDVIGWLVGGFEPDGTPTYDIDGVALDYVRFVGAGTGNNPALVTGFVADVKQVIGVLSLHAYLIANRSAFDGPVYDGNFASYSSVISSLSSQFGQHWEQLAQHVDVMMPMTYTADGNIYSTYALHQGYVRRASQYCRTACNLSGVAGRRVCPVIRTYSDTSETTTPQTIDASITGALLGNADGYQAFRYATMQSSWWPVMQQYATPGQNFPVPVVNASVSGLTATLDTSASRDQDQSSASLTVSVDWDGDGIGDGPFAPSGAFTDLLPGTSPRVFGILVRDAQGHLSATRRRAGGSAALTLPTTTQFASQATNLPITVDVGPAGAGHAYLVLASLAGTTPGVAWGGIAVPLNVDGLTEVFLLAANSAIFPGALGTLDSQGRATATLLLPPGVLDPLRFRVLSWCAIGSDMNAQPAFATNSAGLLIFP
ncbi:MAG: hypothetical protein AB7I19_16150 [Planctomycetota bacterium]